MESRKMFNVNIEDRKLENRKIASGFQKKGEALLLEKKYMEASANFRKAIYVYDKAPDDVRLLSSCHNSLVDACLTSLKVNAALDEDIDLSAHFLDSINLLNSIAEKTKEDFFNLGIHSFRFAKMQVLFKEYDAAANLFVNAAENFINHGNLQHAAIALSEFEAIKTYTSLKNPRLRIFEKNPQSAQVEKEIKTNNQSLEIKDADTADIEIRKIETRKLAFEFQNEGLRLLNENKCKESIEFFSKAINLYDYASEDARLISSCSIAFADIITTYPWLGTKEENKSIESFYLTSIDLLNAMKKTNQDFLNLGDSYLKLAKLHIRHKKYDLAAELFLSSTQAFVSAVNLENAEMALREFEAIMPCITQNAQIHLALEQCQTNIMALKAQKKSHLKLLFLSNMNAKPQSAQVETKIKMDNVDYQPPKPQ